MSLNPIFDATLADAPADIFLASPVFPNPVVRAIEKLQESLFPTFSAPFVAEFTDWRAVAQQPIWAAEGVA